MTILNDYVNNFFFSWYKFPLHLRRKLPYESSSIAVVSFKQD